MNKTICPVCGRVDNEGAAYCKDCGAKMVAYEDPNSASGQGGQFSGYQDYTGSNSYGTSTGNGSGGGSQYNNYQDYTNIPYQQPVYEGPDNKANGLQIAGLVCGILGICSCCCYGIPAVILGIAGLVCSLMGNKQSKNGIGIAGLVCSIIGIILGCIGVIYFAWVIRYMTEYNLWP